MHIKLNLFLSFQPALLLPAFIPKRYENMQIYIGIFKAVLFVTGMQDKTFTNTWVESIQIKNLLSAHTQQSGCFSESWQ